MLGQFLRSQILKEPRGEGQQLFSATSQLKDHKTSLGIEVIPSHVVVTEEVDIVETADTYVVLRPFVNINVLIDARITDQALTSSPYNRKSFVIVDGSLTLLCVLELVGQASTQLKLDTGRLKKDWILCSLVICVSLRP